MPDFWNDWFTPNIPFLSRVLSGIAHVPGLEALEIGCFDGRSSCWFMDHILDGSGSCITCIDHFLGGKDHNGLIDMTTTESRFRSNISPYGDRVRLLKGLSSEVLTSAVIGPCDFIYVDGSHESADVLEDAVLSWPMLKHGGIMIFDDYQWGLERPPDQRPGIGIDSFLSAYRGKLTIIDKGYQMAVRKTEP